jgi:hypothetical protein
MAQLRPYSDSSRLNRHGEQQRRPGQPGNVHCMNMVAMTCPATLETAGSKRKETEPAVHVANSGLLPGKDIVRTTIACSANEGELLPRRDVT